MPDADDIELEGGRNVSPRMSFKFRLSYIDGFEKGSTPIFLDHYQLSQKQRVLYLYQSKILDLLGQQAKEKLETLTLGEGLAWMCVPLRTEGSDEKRSSKRRKRHKKVHVPRVLVPRSPEGLQRLQMASRLFCREGGAVSFLVGQPATIGVRRELVVGHIIGTEYTDCNLASVNAGIMHANLWEHTPQNIRQRFEDAERQAQNVLINTCTRIENFPTAVDLLREELCPVS